MPKRHCSEEVGLRVQKFFTNLGLIVNTMRGGGRGGGCYMIM